MALNKQIKILLYGSNLRYLGEGMLGPLFAIFSEKVGGDILDVTWAWAIYLIVTGVLYLIVGKATDAAYSKEKILVFGYALNTLFTFGYLLVDAPRHLFFVQIGLGIAAAMAGPTWSALYAKHEDRRNDGYARGLAGGSAEIITGCALITGGYIVTYAGFDVLFIIMGIIQAVATVYQAQILKHTQKHVYIHEHK